MYFTATFFALLAVAQSAVSVPFASSGDVDVLAPVPVTKLVCDGDTYKCTASLDYGNGGWVAQWRVSVFHTGLFGAPDHKIMSAMTMAPVPVKEIECDGDTYKCTAKLEFGDKNWVAQWPVNVFHSGNAHALAPVPVKKMTCDGDSYKCTANLDYGDGNWVSQWATNVFHTSNPVRGFLSQN